MAPVTAVSGINDQVGSLRQRLKQDTLQLHEAVDRKYGSQDLQTVSGLSQFLGAQFVAYATLARWLEGLSHFLQPRLDQLSADLHTLGMSIPDVPLALPKERHQPDGAMPDGVMYVLLGSQLGARVLRRHWQGSADERVLQANRFLTDESQSGSWQEFVRYCAAQPAMGEVADQIVRSAEATFQIFINGFDAVVGRSGEPT